MLCGKITSLLIFIKLDIQVMIIIVFGLPGSGKTYLASRLAKKIGVKRISSDVLRKELVKSPTYSKDEKLLIYKKMFEIMCDYVSNREHLIIDGTFYKAAMRNTYIKQIELQGGEIKFIEIKADKAIIKERLSHERINSDADYHIYELIAREFEPYIEDHLILHSTNDNIVELLETAISYLAIKLKSHTLFQH
jgi:predicted kinase